MEGSRGSMGLFPSGNARQTELDRRTRSADLSWQGFALPWTLALLGWSVLCMAFLTGRNVWLDHDKLLVNSNLPWLLALLIFLLGWQLMLLAMMLPALLALLSTFYTHYQRYRYAQTIFLIGYSTAWTLFALAAFIGDTLLHTIIQQWWWLYMHPQWIGALLLCIAGIFQWSSLKQRYILRCATTESLLRAEQERQQGSFWQQGWRYGIWDIGCNWALMLVMVGLGMRSLLTMALLSAIMWIEHANAHNKHLRLSIGLALCLLGCLWLFFPLI